MKRLTFILLIFLQCSIAFALTIPEKPSSYVNDYASLLSGPAKQKIESELAAFEKETSHQIVVAVFPSLEGGSLEDFSIRFAEKWKIGQKGRENGVIFVIFKEDRAVHIVVGYGLEGALPDDISKRIIEREIVPSFKREDFDGGVLKAVEAIELATKGEYKAADSVSGDTIQKYTPQIFFMMFFYFLFPIACYFILTFFLFTIFGVPGALAGMVLSAVLEFLRRIFLLPHIGQTFSGRSFGGGGFGGGGFSGGGGFGGGGGGSFGGGGASGRW